jgi:isopenicillin N synthase-like dioxygenase
VPLFYNPTLSSVITPLDLPDTLEWERPKEYQHWERSHNAMMATVGDNTLKSLARSHPEVFQRHHSDLRLLEDGQIVANNK